MQAPSYYDPCRKTIHGLMPESSHDFYAHSWTNFSFCWVFSLGERWRYMSLTPPQRCGACKSRSLDVCIPQVWEIQLSLCAPNSLPVRAKYVRCAFRTISKIVPSLDAPRAVCSHSKCDGIGQHFWERRLFFVPNYFSYFYFALVLLVKHEQSKNNETYCLPSVERLLLRFEYEEARHKCLYRKDGLSRETRNWKPADT